MSNPLQEDSGSSFLLRSEALSSHIDRYTIEVDSSIVSIIYKQTVNIFQERIRENGFIESPITYIENNYKKEINFSVKNFILRHYVIDYLTNQISTGKIISANHPRLTHMELSENGKALFTFDISKSANIPIREWKHFSFKAPKRKNYKDLDKQVTLFLKREQELSKKQNKNCVEENDWVCFDALLVDKTGNLILSDYKNSLWVRINLDAISDPLVEIFKDKFTGDSFLTNELSLLDDFDHNYTGKHYFLITINSIVKGSFCGIDHFRAMFKLKNKTEIHEKLIEVFSYRNDISQRRSIIEEMFNLFFTKHRFELPKHLVIRKQKDILHSLKERPDYQVYKSNKNFTYQLGILAEKQLKEEVLIDQISNHEKIKIELKDIQNYLNLFTNKRLKEFVYFKPPQELLEDSTTPILDSTLKHLCRREKTLNYILYNLTR